MKTNNTTTGIDEHIEAALCYFFLWVGAIVFLIIENKSKFVRFHAMQSLLVFLSLSIVSFIFKFIPILGIVFSYIVIPIIMIILWIVLTYLSYKGEKYKIPFIGYIAEDIISGK